MFLLKFSNLEGLPLIIFETGERIGSLKDLALHENCLEISGLVFKIIGFSTREYVLPTESVYKVGNHAVLCYKEYFERFKNKIKCDSKNTVIQLKWKPVCTRTGQEIGMVSDLILNMTLFEVCFIEVSNGIIKDIFDGRKLLPLLGRITFGTDYVLIDDEVLQEAQDNFGKEN